MLSCAAPIKDVLDAPAHPNRGFWFCLPDRFKDAKDIFGCDRGHVQVADDRDGVAVKRVPPLLAMLRIFPGGFVRTDVSIRGFPEGDHGWAAVLSKRGLLSGFDRVDPLL